MAVNYGQIATGASTDTAQSYFVTTGSVNTNATGSSFAVYVIHKQNVQNRNLTITDSFGNTYTQIGTTQNDGSAVTMVRYLCTNGTGGTGHTFTATNPTNYGPATVSSTTSTTITVTGTPWTTNEFQYYWCFNSTRLQQAEVQSNTNNTLTFSAVPAGTAAGDTFIVGNAKMTIVAVEITGGATSSLLDQYSQYGGYNSPSSLPGITLGSEASHGALLVTIYQVEAFATVTYTTPTGFTNVYSYGSGTAYPNSLLCSVAVEVVSGAGTYTPVWAGGGSTYESLALDSFLAATPNAASFVQPAGAIATLNAPLTTAVQFPLIPLLTNLTPANTGLSQTPQTVGGYLNTAFGYLNSGRTVFNQEVTYSMTGSVDSPVISGDSPGYTNSYVITPNAAGYTLNGLISAGSYSMQNGFTRMITNGSGTYSFTLGHETSGTTPNRFICPSGTGVVVPPYGTVILRYSTVLVGSTVK